MSEMKNDTDASVSNSTIATQRAIEGTTNTENVRIINPNIQVNNFLYIFQQNGQPAELQRQPSKLESFFSIVKSLIIRGIIIYFISSFFRGPQAPKATEKGVQVAYTPARNIFQEGTVLNLYVYLSENETVNDYHPSNLFWYKEGLKYGDWTSGPNRDGTYVIEKSVPVTPNMRNNGSLFLHAFLIRTGYSPDPTAENFARNQMSSVMKQLNR